MKIEKHGHSFEVVHLETAQVPPAYPAAYASGRRTSHMWFIMWSAEKYVSADYRFQSLVML